MSASYRISQASALSGVSTANIRFYEKEKLFSPRGRSDNSYRFYSDDDVHQLRFIRLCRAMDMSLDEVRSLLVLDLNSKDDCAAARASLDGHIGHVRARLQELKTLEKDLQSLRLRCDGTDDSCRIIEALHQRADVLPAAPSLIGPTNTGGKAKRHV